jgi:hypothetical protein
MPEIDRKKIAKYFNPFPTWTIIFIVIGVLLVAVKGIGLIPLIIGGVGLYFYFSGKPTDQEMDTWLQEELRVLNGRALQKCGLDQSEVVAESVAVWGPRVVNTGGIPFQIKTGKDGQIRYNPIDLSVLNFGQNQLLGYQCAYDRFTGNCLQETTDEYFYKDVVSVSTKTDTTSKDVVVGKKQVERVQLKNSEMFRLTTSGGTSIEVFIKDEGLLGLKSAKGGQLPTSQAEKAVATVRRMLRDKKAN